MSAFSRAVFDTLPIHAGTDGGGFNPNTMEAFSSQGDGTLSIIKEISPTSFVAEPVVQTQRGGKTCTVDTKNNRVIVIATERAAASPPAANAAPPEAAAATPPAGGPPGGGRRGGRGGGGGPGFLDIIAVGR